MVFLLALFLVISVLATRLAGKSVSDMTYIVSSGTLNLNSINQSINQREFKTLTNHLFFIHCLCLSEKVIAVFCSAVVHQLPYQKQYNCYSDTLQCLSVEGRIQFKLASYEILCTGTPSYLSNYLHIYIRLRTLQSSSFTNLHVSPTISVYAYIIATETFWNSPFHH